MNVKDVINQLRVKKAYPAFRVGDTISVHVRIREAEKERIQIFEGIVIKRRRAGKGSSFTVRKISYGIGVERVFPYESQAVEKVEIKQKGKVRRARLFYLRSRRGKASQVEQGGPLSEQDRQQIDLHPELTDKDIVGSDAEPSSSSRVVDNQENASVGT